MLRKCRFSDIADGKHFPDHNAGLVKLLMPMPHRHWSGTVGLDVYCVPSWLI